jgi:hypothetical protein
MDGMSTKLPSDPSPEQPEPSGSSTAWQEVGHEFETLGASLAAAFRRARDSSENRERVSDLQNGLRAMIDEVRRAVDDTASSPEGSRVRSEAARAAASVRSAAEATVQEVRPALLAALRQVNQELNRVNQRLDGDAPPPPEPDRPSNTTRP